MVVQPQHRLLRLQSVAVTVRLSAGAVPVFATCSRANPPASSPRLLLLVLQR
eukprot:COSAG04_NODE_10365_length_783_cov_1.280702_1_plen_51_part_10